MKLTTDDLRAICSEAKEASKGQLKVRTALKAGLNLGTDLIEA